MESMSGYETCVNKRAHWLRTVIRVSNDQNVIILQIYGGCPRCCTWIDHARNISIESNELKLCLDA
jgi:hypothetical protein